MAMSKMPARAGCVVAIPARAKGRAKGLVAIARRVIAAAAIAATAGCSRSPSQDILGSFFPSWLLCLLVGVVAAVIARALLIAIGLGEALYAPLLAYPAIALAVTLAIWLVRFGN